MLFVGGWRVANALQSKSWTLLPGRAPITVMAKKWRLSYVVNLRDWTLGRGDAEVCCL